MPAHLATVAALAVAPSVRFRVIINVRATAAPRQKMNVNAYRYPYLFILSIAVGAHIATVITCGVGHIPSVRRLRDHYLAAAAVRLLVRGRRR